VELIDRLSESAVTNADLESQFMSDEKPPIIDYQGPHPNEPRDEDPVFGRFFGGLVAGSAASFFVYLLSNHLARERGVMTMFLVLAAGKTIASIGLMFVPSWRRFGAGLLTSMPVGAMIWVFVICGVR
jgi:hypothetical protein